MSIINEQNQHWVPQFLIRNFADADGKVYLLDKKTNWVGKRPPKYVAANPAFNDFIIDGKEVSFEKELARLEHVTAPYLQQILDIHSVATLTNEGRKNIADFIAIQSFRTKAFHDGLQPSMSRAEYGRAFTKLWRDAIHVSVDILARHWVVMLIGHDSVFYLGDSPVVTQYTDRTAVGPTTGFGIEGVEAYLPLSPKCALYMPCPKTCQQIIETYEFSVLAPELAANTKEEILSNADRITYLAAAERLRKQAFPLYESMTKGQAYVCDEENVENLNYLQCAYSLAEIYSNRKDFEFAKMVFRKTPQYRNAPSSTIELVHPSQMKF